MGPGTGRGRRLTNAQRSEIRQRLHTAKRIETSRPGWAVQRARCNSGGPRGSTAHAPAFDRHLSLVEREEISRACRRSARCVRSPRPCSGHRRPLRARCALIAGPRYRACAAERGRSGSAAAQAGQAGALSAAAAGGRARPDPGLVAAPDRHLAQAELSRYHGDAGVGRDNLSVTVRPGPRRLAA